ncbi:tetratricopeptide repeat protein [Gaetbulibacter saemankumensis]|uniref:tetratricopeptide repeat protein n=1 Tax=Gaetbulibacter saemankumensis TaxID=311208 RepID=UPI00040209DF|nr:tetratricopeptide repeat protein [Gaetbulibacter saemankumensis]
MKLNYITLLSILVLCFSCSQSHTKRITDATDYNTYLNASNKDVVEQVKNELTFWRKRLTANEEQFPNLSKLGATYSELFEITGRITYLKKAEESYEKLNVITNYKNTSYLRSLSANYIKQHKFQEALKLLKKAEVIGENLRATQKMLFDVYLELGNYELAKDYLNKINNDSDFDYLIRVAKWSDYRGDLDSAIKYFELAKNRAQLENNSTMKQWIYTNLGDFYGHQGDVERSYQHYLKALELNPNDAYAKKGVAWIVYSSDKNPEEALRILNCVTENFEGPDYFLLKAEIAEFMGASSLSSSYLNKYQELVKNEAYGAMYNKYTALLFAENERLFSKALNIAREEIKNRPTPLSYDLLAWTFFNQGEVKEALRVMEKYVVGKTFEPSIMLHLAQIYKVNGKLNEANILKESLEESTFELGPLKAEKIKNI